MTFITLQRNRTLNAKNTGKSKVKENNMTYRYS